VVQENLACENPSRLDSFDFILAHYLIQSVDGFTPLKVCEVLRNLHSYLRKGGELVVIEPEPHVPFRPEYEITSMYEVRGDAELEKRSNRDLIDVLYFLVTTATRLTLLNTAIEGNYPSEWIYNWLNSVGFTILEKCHFGIKMYVDKEFTQRTAFARNILSKMDASKLRDGLLEKLEMVVSEFRRRNVPEDDLFLHRHYVIRAQKD
jgi:SAM-dependent methyltransferase